MVRSSGLLSSLLEPGCPLGPAENAHQFPGHLQIHSTSQGEQHPSSACFPQHLHILYPVDLLFWGADRTETHLRRQDRRRRLGLLAGMHLLHPGSETLVVLWQHRPGRSRWWPVGLPALCPSHHKTSKTSFCGCPWCVGIQVSFFWSSPCTGRLCDRCPFHAGCELCGQTRAGCAVSSPVQSGPTRRTTAGAAPQSPGRSSCCLAHVSFRESPCSKLGVVFCNIWGVITSKQQLCQPNSRNTKTHSLNI